MTGSTFFSPGAPRPPVNPEFSLHSLHWEVGAGNMESPAQDLTGCACSATAEHGWYHQVCADAHSDALKQQISQRDTSMTNMK